MHPVLVEDARLPGALGGIPLDGRSSDLPVISGDRLEGVARDPSGDQRWCRSEQRVADLDVGVEEGQRRAGFQRLQPQADLRKFSGQRVDVHPVDAPSDHLAERRPQRDWTGLGVPCVERGDPLGDPTRRGH